MPQSLFFSSSFWCWGPRKLKQMPFCRGLALWFIGNSILRIFNLCFKKMNSTAAYCSQDAEFSGESLSKQNDEKIFEAILWLKFQTSQFAKWPFKKKNDMRDDTYQTHLEIAARRQHHGIHSEIQRHLRLLHLLAPVLAVLSGILHAYGMALRKRHGNDASAQYWMQPGWWIGLLMDALGGWNVWYDYGVGGFRLINTHSWFCEFMWIFGWG